MLSKTEAAGLSVEELAKRLGTSPEGLTEKEASARLAAYGANVLGHSSVRALPVLARQFKSSLVYLLVIASGIAYGIHDFTDGSIILAILLINAALGFYQEYKSERIVEKLQHLITKQVRVARDGALELRDETCLVPGDVVTVREGDIAPADLRLTAAEDLQVNESQLTGESVPVAKRAAAEGLAAPECVLVTGSVIEKGIGTGIVYATGRSTELGAIARLSTETKKHTQYEKSLQSFSVVLMRIIVGGLALVFAAKLFFAHGSTDFTTLLLFVIALAVSTVPEALPVIATVTLSSGALKLAKRHVVVKRLSSLEDLGNVNLLCTDKTGTITENKMAIEAVTSAQKELFETLAYASIEPLKSRKRRMHNTYGDAFAAYVPETIKKEAAHFAIVKELPFDPEARRSRTVLEDTRTHAHYLLAMGAPDALLAIAHAPEASQHRRVIAEEGAKGLHHLALAYRTVRYEDGFDILAHERDLSFLGYASFSDPLRASAKATIERATKLGIKVKLLTGDSPEVAAYIGERVGLMQEGGKVYLGDELSALTPDAFKKAVLESDVFARVSPAQKFAIVGALKEQYVVAYQGDGINDAPALKLADVAIAVNTATDIAKENADIVLLQQNLEVVISAIHFGRSIFVNINKYIRYTMSNNFGIFIALSALYLISVDLPILPVQVLLNNLLGDIPLVMVSSDSVENEEVVRPERHDVRELMALSLILGIPTALFEIGYFFMIRGAPLAVVQTSLFVFFTLQALIVFYTVRTKKHFWQTKPPSVALNFGFFLAFFASLAAIYLPRFGAWFSFVPLSATAIAAIGTLMLAYLLAADVIKVQYYRSRFGV